MSEKANGGEGMAQVEQVSEEHKRLEPFVGVFKAEVKLWMGPGDPLVSTGTMTNSWDLGGRFLSQTYKGDPSPGPFGSFEGRGFWGYNTTSGKYEGFWIDNASTVMQFEAGDVDAAGRVWTMSGEMMNPSTHEPMQRKSVITLQDQDRHRLDMFFSKSGGEEFRTMQIQYERKS